MKPKVCLFSAHSPNTGGGAVILRSLISHLPELNIQWKYLSAQPVKGFESGHLGQGIMGSSIVNDVIGTWRMLRGAKVSRADEIVQQLLAAECDAYWVISHNEGLRIALELKKLQKDRPVHVTFHDDWAGSLASRSKRYFLFAGLAKKMAVKVMKSVNNFDVISKGMQSYYKTLSGQTGEICHRYLEPLQLNQDFTKSDNNDQLTIGHIGSVYDKNDLIKFLETLKQYGAEKNKKIRLNMWGYHPTSADIPSDYSDIISIKGDLSEDKVLLELAKCKMVYCMYPMDKNASLFSQTSLPTKLSSYVMAGRPIFGQGPSDSTLAEFIKTTSTGSMWSNHDNKKGIEVLDLIIKLDVNENTWQKARELYFGESNLNTMRNTFMPSRNASENAE
jgi:hypothetical protein